MRRRSHNPCLSCLISAAKGLVAYYDTTRRPTTADAAREAESISLRYGPTIAASGIGFELQE